jgi:hypothetical protein
MGAEMSCICTSNNNDNEINPTSYFQDRMFKSYLTRKKSSEMLIDKCFTYENTKIVIIKEKFLEKYFKTRKNLTVPTKNLIKTTEVSIISFP